jgi:hypothetical protein
MGLFDSIQNIIGGAADSAQGSIGDAVGGIADNQIVQDLQDQATTITDGATEAVTSVTEQGQTVVEDITQNLGL